MDRTLKIVMAAVLAVAGAAGAGYLSCGCGSTSQVIARQGPPAAACVPEYLPLILDCAQKHDAGCAVIHAVELVACWVQHEPKEAPPAVDAGQAQ